MWMKEAKKKKSVFITLLNIKLPFNCMVLCWLNLLIVQNLFSKKNTITESVTTERQPLPQQTEPTWILWDVAYISSSQQQQKNAI